MIKPTSENGSNTNANPFLDPPQSSMGPDGGAMVQPLKQQLVAAMRQTVPLDDGEPQSFLPADELNRLVTQDSAVRTLQGCPGSDMIHSIFAYAIFSPARQLLKIFAILVLIDRPDAIGAFMSESISDADLPLVSTACNASGEETTVVRSKTTPSCFDLARAGFDRGDAAAFEETQWKVLSPAFEPIGAPSAPYMYRFHQKTILPFVWDESAEPVTLTGGHSKVYQANIHPGHHTFNLPRDSRFAIKKLHSTDNEAFEREVDALRRFSNDADTHIINLLVAFKHGDTSYLVFPWADTDLHSFWDTHDASPAKDDHAVLTVKQMLGVAEALKAIHYARAKKRAKAQQQALSPTVEEEGYHADVKPENILMVDGKWKLADFGLAKFRRREESGKQDRPLGCSPTYRAPEHDVGTFNGQKADIWSLGCVMSVAATWMTLGRKGVRSFRAKRAQGGARPASTPERRVDDSFFEVSKNGGEKTRLKLKPEVCHWFDKLHETPTASPLMHDLLDLVQNDMLEVDGAKRITSDKLVEKLERIHRRCSEDDTYAKPDPRPVKTKTKPRAVSCPEEPGQRSISVNMVRVPSPGTWPIQGKQQESYHLEPGLGGSSAARSSTAPFPFSCYPLDCHLESSQAQAFGSGLNPSYLQPPYTGGPSPASSSISATSPKPQARKKQRSRASLKGKRRKMDAAGTRSPSAAPETSELGDSDPSSKILYACPYFKFDPTKYGTKEWNSCGGPGWEIPRLKEHINRKHYKPGFRCNRCLVWYETQEALDQHQWSDVQCPNQPRRIDEVIDSAQWGRIQDRKRGKADVSKWEDIYRVIFRLPSGASIPSPYREVETSPFAARFCGFLNSQLRLQPNPQRQSDILASFRMLQEFQNSQNSVSSTQSSILSDVPPLTLTMDYSNASTAMSLSPLQITEPSPQIGASMEAVRLDPYVVPEGQEGMASYPQYGDPSSQLNGISDESMQCWFTPLFMEQSDATGNDQIGLPPGGLPGFRFNC